MNLSNRNLVLTVDYEIFGMGAGDVLQHAVKPTEAMCRIAERYQFPMTIFVEMEEYIAFKENASGLKKSLGYDPAKAMGEQIRSLTPNGHDVQLHLHPWWLGAKWCDGRWQFDYDWNTVDSLHDSVDDTFEYISERQDALEELSGCKPCAFRAGTFAAQPGEKLLESLRRSGFLVDSSVVKGLFRPMPNPQAVDFRNTPPLRSWRIKRDVAVEDRDGELWEVPVHSIMKRRFQRISAKRLKAKFSKNIPEQQRKDTAQALSFNSDPLGFPRYLSERVPITLDFHNISASRLIKMILDAPAPQNNEPDVIVLIGHSKEHVSDNDFESFIKKVSAHPELDIVSLREVAESLNKSTKAKAL